MMVVHLFDTLSCFSRCDFLCRGKSPKLQARSRLTFTTGVTSSPSRFTSKTINGANKNSSQKSNNIEMMPVFHHNDGDISPSMKDTCVTIADVKELL
ncbi:substance-K receptor [Trichonephila clavipes]|nr:substance-K receptor [Trichonephila clavipes]